MSRSARAAAWAFYPRPRPEPFWRKVWNGWFIATVVVLVVLTELLSGFWVLQYPNLLANDAMSMLAGSRDASKTEVVYVDEEDHATFFQRKSPLDVGVLEKAIRLVLDHQPCVLVVDFDTSDPSFANLKVPETSAPIVWARALYWVPVGRGKGKLWVRNVLGRASEDVNQGFAVASLDLDGTVRRLDREIPVNDKWFPTLHWRAVTEYRRVVEGRAAAGVGSLVQTFPPAEIARLAAHFRRQEWNLRDLERTGKGGLPDFSGKVVLLGGKYDGGDVVRTTFGPEWGIDLLAGAVEVELAGVGAPGIPKLPKYGLKAVVALLIAFAYHRLRPVAATLAVLGALLPAVLFGNVLAVYLWGFEGMVVPFALGVLVEQLVTLVETAQHGSQASGGHSHA